MIKPTIFNASWIAALACALSLLAIQVGAQTAAPATEVLSLGEIESRLTAQGITIHEIELRDRVVEVEGRDAQGRKVELLIDRRSGEILSNKPDR
jgi:hypothetical protein